MYKKLDMYKFWVNGKIYPFSMKIPCFLYIPKEKRITYNKLIKQEGDETNEKKERRKQNRLFAKEYQK